jgi:putative redox protein
MDAKVTWKSGLNFTGKAESGFDVPMDASVDHGGTGLGSSPMELILVGLGGCTAMDVISILQKKRQDVTSFEVVLHGERAADHPKVYTEITMEYIVIGHGVDLESVERAVELSEGKYCSVNGMLKQSVKINTKCTVKEVLP